MKARVLSVFLAVLAVSALPVIAGDSPRSLIVEKATEWTDLFDRTSGWTGADGI